ncbi:MAG: GNAT family N-acetyltransferase [Alphaproteobacteria bacterium]
MMRVEQIEDNRSQICREVLETLPEWFGLPDSLTAYAEAAETLPMLGCIVQGQVVGMLTLKRHSDWNTEIAVMGVLPDWHRKGVGEALVQAAIGYAQADGCRLLTVKTLAEHHPDPGYAATRRFYHAMGFRLFEEFPELWGADNPCALCVLPVSD